MPMIYLLRRLQRSKASDPRDHVFALLGIASDAEELGLEPAYSQSREQVYTELARKLLMHGYWNVLSHCLHEPHTGKTASLRLQSWVPDWSQRTSCSPLQQRALDRTRKPALRTMLQPEFRASGRRVSEIEAPGDDWNSPLTVEAIRVGTVAQRGRVWSNNSGPGGWLKDLQDLSQSSLSRLTEPSERRNRVWRTAVADQDIRRYNTKPRLPPETVDKLNVAFSDTQLTSIDVQALVTYDLGSYAEQMQSSGKGRCPSILSNGCLALVPEEVRKGDEVVIVFGAEVPFVIRPRAGNGSYVFVGEAFVYGCMDGEHAGAGAEVCEMVLC